MLICPFLQVVQHYYHLVLCCQIRRCSQRDLFRIERTWTLTQKPRKAKTKPLTKANPESRLKNMLIPNPRIKWKTITTRRTNILPHFSGFITFHMINKLTVSDPSNPNSKASLRNLAFRHITYLFDVIFDVSFTSKTNGGLEVLTSNSVLSKPSKKPAQTSGSLMKGVFISMYLSLR